MRTFLLRLFNVALGGLLLIVGGCASSPPTQFYVLAHLPTSAQPAAITHQDIAVGVGPVELPEYLDRPQIVTRTSHNELTLAEFDQWAEPLKDNFTQVLAENLAELLSSQRVVVYPWKRATPINCQVVVKVIRFDRSVGGDSVLNTRWSILSSDGGKVLLTRQSSYGESPAGPDYPATVAAMNQTLAAFSRDVAAAIKDLKSASSRY